VSPLDSYRRLFGLTGATYILVAFLARLPLAMGQLGVLLLVAGSTGSYGAGGVCAGSLAVANAVGAPVWGARADRSGQRRVVVLQSLAGAAALAGILLVVGSGLPWGVAAVASAVAGLLMPQVGPLARVRWRPLAAATGRHQARLVATAFSWEGAADEASFVLGPAIVGLGVSLVSPTAALAFAAGTLAVFGTWFALHETAVVAHRAARVAEQAAGRAAGRLVSPAFVALATAQLLIGAFFGSVQTGTSVLATAAGSPGLTGYLHALLGVGSVLAGLAIATLPPTLSLPARLRWFAVGLLGLSVPLLTVGTFGALVPVLLVLGCTVAPYMITTFTLAERVAPPSRTGAAMTALAATTGLGYALGAAVAGRLADWGGQTPAYAVTVAASALAVGLSWSFGGVLRRADQAASGRTGVGSTDSGAGVSGPDVASAA
jgi:hypothetical protein